MDCPSRPIFSRSSVTVPIFVILTSALGISLHFLERVNEEKRATAEALKRVRATALRGLSAQAAGADQSLSLLFAREAVRGRIQPTIAVVRGDALNASNLSRSGQPDQKHLAVHITRSPASRTTCRGLPRRMVRTPGNRLAKARPSIQ